MSGPWTCFFCGDTFTERSAAALHFGTDEDQQPACLIKGGEGGLLQALRETEDALFQATRALHDESADALKAWRASLSRHAAALRSAEEVGYTRGVDDARKEREPAKTEPSTCAFCDNSGWVEDQNWTQDYPAIEQERRPGSGLIRCMAYDCPAIGAAAS